MAFAGGARRLRQGVGGGRGHFFDGGSFGWGCGRHLMGRARGGGSAATLLARRSMGSHTALHLSSFLTSPPFLTYRPVFDRLGEHCEGCSRGLPRSVSGSGSFLAGERTAVCMTALPRWLRIDEGIALLHRNEALGQPRERRWHHSS